MPVTTRQRKAPKPTAPPPVLINPSPACSTDRSSGVVYKDDDPFEAAFDTFNNSSSESESDSSDFDYGKRGPSLRRNRVRKWKKAGKKRKAQSTTPGPAPEPPVLSDHDLGDDEEEDSALSSRRTDSPSIIRLEVGGNTTIDLNISDLIQQHGSHFNPASPLAKQDGPAKAAGGTSTEGGWFMRLPPELRNRVYRMVLVTNTPVVFHRRDNFERSGQFLRTCREIAEEGTRVMYGENSFHFERTAETRGKFWDSTWKEIGYKDIRRFLETIGPFNVSKLKYLSFNLEDSLLCRNRDSDPAERKFVNDPVLHRIFNIISANAMLSRIDVFFGGRAQVQLTDYHFLKSLSGIRSPAVNFPRNLRGFPTRVNDAVLDKISPIMTIADADAAKVDQSQIKKKIKMHLDQPTTAKYSTFGW